MILLLGGSGYVGGVFQKHLTGLNIPFEVVSRRSVDYADPRRLVTFLRERRPQFVINAAGFTGRPNVDACEIAKTECLAGNAVLPGVIRAACEAVGVPWGHVSSGCIFTGARPDGSGFREDDAPNFSFRTNNCSFYSGCKALGEEVLGGAEQCFIWRLRIPFSEIDSPRNYISKMIRYDRLLEARNSLSQLDEFAAACFDCWQKRVPFGTYNLTNPGSVSTRDVVDLIRKHGLSSRAFSFFDSEEQFMAKAAKTPRSNCVLDVSKAQAAGIRMTEVHDALEKAMGSWQWAKE
jgi:dTDP-4-dehydrorhamnose reductase